MSTKHTRLPDYQNPDKRSVLGKWNDGIYLRALDEFQVMLSKHSLQDALRLLHEQQTDAGFIIDDLSAVRNFQCHCPQGDMFFIGQYNPTRMRRFQGIGRNVPPEGVATRTTRSLKCFICVDNIGWQSKGVQLYYRFTVNGNDYAALCNPFPFMPTHITIASVEHRPQSWHGNTQEEEGNIQRIVEDIYGISAQLPGWVCFYNGVGAGASIEGHFHYQAFKTPDGHGLFPLQHAARQIEQRANEAISMPASEAAASVLIVDSGHYPLTAFRISGSRNHMVGAAIARISEWSNTVGSAASANLIAVHEKGQVIFYLVPRNERYFKVHRSHGYRWWSGSHGRNPPLHTRREPSYQQWPDHLWLHVGHSEGRKPAQCPKDDHAVMSLTSNHIRPPSQDGGISFLLKKLLLKMQ